MLKFSYGNSGLSESNLEITRQIAKKAEEKLVNRNGEGSEFLGWLDLPTDYNKKEFEDILNTAEKIKSESEVLLVCGIGGSYLGARAGIEFLNGTFDRQVLFVGNSISADYLNDLIEYVKDKEVSLNVISKSGTTLEPALAFRFLRQMMEEKYGDKAGDRIYATTDAKKGVLKKLAEEKGYKTFIVPDDIGGRYSVLTPVGLLPLAVAGADLYKLMQGARNVMSNSGILEYACVRNKLAEGHKPIEVLVAFEPYLQMFTEWWKQLFGESEGKDGKGIFPASMIFSTDLHSLGQYMQDGRRLMFETVIKVTNSHNKTEVPHSNIDDSLGFLEGKTIDLVQEGARMGTEKAHVDGGVPNLLIEIDERNEETLGELIYFFEKACAISGYMMGVNPFNQPGVEEYKREMFEILRR